MSISRQVQPDQLVPRALAGAQHVEAEHPRGADDEQPHRIEMSELSPDHEAVGAGLAVAAAHGHVAPEQRGLHAPVEVAHGAAREQDRVLDLGARDRAALADRRVRPDVAVGQARVGADDRRAAHGRALEARARARSTTRPSTCESISSPSHALEHVVEDQAVGLEHVLQAPGVLPPAAHDVRLHAHARVDQVLDRVGDLELAARRGLGSRAPRRGSRR